MIKAEIGRLRDSLTDTLVRGSLDIIHGDVLHGWLLGAAPDLRPIVMVDGKPARIMDRSIPRPDVCKKYGLGETVSPGFACRLPVADAGARLSLFAAGPQNIFHIVTKILRTGICEQNFATQTVRYAEIAKQKDAVGIVCWDGAHNCIGRAKTLYDIISQERPAVVLCYLHEEFGGKLWEPLLGDNVPIITIPWQRRKEAHELLGKYGIAFNTVWICKPRYPSFLLGGVVSHEATKFVLDIDDEEDAFLGCDGLINADYELQGANVAHFLRDQVGARTVSGPRLQHKYGGHIVRHARAKNHHAEPQDSDVKHIRFIGTVREHKNVQNIARAIHIIADRTDLALRFHVHGDIQPPELRQELENNGAIVHEGSLPFPLLGEVLEKSHVLITGFPTNRNEKLSRKITEYQVPAKISDALASGRPVLVPDSPAVEDLGKIPGVYLFNESTFRQQLMAALGLSVNKIEVPYDFTPTGAYEAFRLAEREAMPAFAINALKECSSVGKYEAGPTLVLLWKQQDAGLYGRRIDQIARSYRRKFPNHKVVILEFFEQIRMPEVPADMEIEDFKDEKGILKQLRNLKKNGLVQNGVLHRTIIHSSWPDLREQLEGFLIKENILPKNAVLILFPVISALEDIWDILDPYKKVVDVVDNELGWADSDARSARLLEQYFWLMRQECPIIFNNVRNRDYFVEQVFVRLENTLIIPNWYTLPDDIKFTHRPLPDDNRHIFYSGNMNDRIDWELLCKIAALPNVKLHLAGTASRVSKELAKIIEAGAIYHGITTERQTLALLACMDAALVPHREDEISRYMNTIKIGMYKATDMQVVAPKWIDLCVSSNSSWFAYEDINSCIKLVSGLTKIKSRDSIAPYNPTESEDAYMSVLSNIYH